MVTLVEDSITDEELRSEPSQKLLIINKMPLWDTPEPRDTFLPRETRVYLLRLQCHSNVRVRPIFQ